MYQIFEFTIISYQRIKRLLFMPTCRFHPSCSQYALEAVKKYGFFKGLSLAALRILRCSPFSKGGYDPVR